MCRQHVSFQLREKYCSRHWIREVNQWKNRSNCSLMFCCLLTQELSLFGSWLPWLSCQKQETDFVVHLRQILLVFVPSSKLPHFQWQDWRHQSVSLDFFWQTKNKCDREIQEKTVRQKKERHSSSFPTQASCFALFFSLLYQKSFLYLYVFINLCLSLNALRCVMNIMVVDSKTFNEWLVKKSLSCSS